MMMIVDQCVNQQSLVLIRSLSECWFFDGSDLIHNRCNMLNFWGPACLSTTIRADAFLVWLHSAANNVSFSLIPLRMSRRHATQAR